MAIVRCKVSHALYPIFQRGPTHADTQHDSREPSRPALHNRAKGRRGQARQTHEVHALHPIGTHSQPDSENAVSLTPNYARPYVPRLNMHVASEHSLLCATH